MNLSRRRFIKLLGGTVALAALPIEALLAKTEPVKQILSTPGYSELPKCWPPRMLWCRAIECYLEEHSPIRRCLMVDEIPCGALPRYETYGDAIAMRDGAIELINASEIIVPTVEFAVQHRNVNWFYEAGGKDALVMLDVAKKFIKYENDCFLHLLSASPRFPEKAHNLKYINRAFREIEKHDAVVVNIVVNQKGLSELKKYTGCFDAPYVTTDPSPRCQNTDILHMLHGIYGHLWTADVRVIDDSRLDNTMYLLPSPDTYGVIAERQSMTHLSSQSPVQDVTYYDIGFAAINPQLAVRLNF